jgi:hypothetical protein
MGLSINFSTTKNFELNLNTTLNDEVDPSHVNTLEMQEVEEIVPKTKGNQCDYFVEEMEEVMEFVTFLTTLQSNIVTCPQTNQHEGISKKFVFATT